MCYRSQVVCLVAATLGKTGGHVADDDPFDDDARDLAASATSLFRVCRASDRTAVDVLFTDVLRKALPRREAEIKKRHLKHGDDDLDQSRARDAKQKELLCYALSLFVLIVLQST